MSRRTISLIVAAFLVIGIIVTIGLSVFKGDNSNNNGQDQNGGATAGRENCEPVNIVSSSEKAGILKEVAFKYNATDPKVQVGADTKCVDVRVASKASGEAEQNLVAGWSLAKDGPYPTVWTPAATTWIKLLDQQLAAKDKPQLVQGKPEALVYTPVVFAIPKPMAEALGWPKTPIGWKTLTALASNPQGWAAYNHPEWGKFTLGKTHPELSTSGLAGTIGEFYAATGETSDLKIADLSKPQVEQAVAAVESAVSHYGDTTLTFLNNQYKLDQETSTPYVSATVVEEKSVIDYNQGNPTGEPGQASTPPRTPLVAVQPAEGTMYSDSPYAILTAPWVTDVQKQGAQNFLTFLKEPAQMQVFTDAGFRSTDGQLGEKWKNDPNLTSTPPATIFAFPRGDVINAIQAQWKDLRKKARIMMILDVSGSMEEDSGNGQSKLEKATQAIKISLNEFNPQDEVGFSIFTTGIPDNYQTLVPVAPMSTNKEKIIAALQLVPLNGTPLYNTIAKAQDDAKKTADPGKINAIVVLTDGKNEADPTLSLDEVINNIKTTRENRNENIKVFTIGYGEDADMAVLEEISSSTGAKAYDATNPANIGNVLKNVMSNF